MTQPPYITCRELIDFIAGYLDGSLGGAPRSEFERHLRVCPSCRDYLDSYRRTVSLGKDALAPTDEPAPGVPESLIKAICAARSKQG